MHLSLADAEAELRFRAERIRQAEPRCLNEAAAVREGFLMRLVEIVRACLDERVFRGLRGLFGRS